MSAKEVTYQIKVTGWELAALTAANVTVFIVAGLFIGAIFRAAHLISLYQPSVDAWSYAEAHLYIVLVEIGLWLLIARAAVRFKAYTRRIQHSRDGAALGFIADAMLLSLVYTMLFNMASTIKTLFMRSPYLDLATGIANLLPLAVFAFLSILLFIGSSRLKHLASDVSQGLNYRGKKLIILSVVGFALLVLPYGIYFSWVAPSLRDDDGLHHFVMSRGMLCVTYLIPFAVTWLLGLLSCLNLARYADSVKGKLYKPMFHKLYLGILVAYLASYLVQIWYASNVEANRFGFGLLSLIGLILMLAAGYLLMYQGASRLYLLEGSQN